jgi:hypothetical protein
VSHQVVQMAVGSALTVSKQDFALIITHDEHFRKILQGYLHSFIVEHLRPLRAMLFIRLSSALHAGSSCFTIGHGKRLSISLMSFSLHLLGQHAQP